MSEDEQPRAEPARSQAVVRHSKWPGWIWIVPLAAVGILIWLGIRFFFTHGASVTVIFDKAPGVSPQNTAVTYRGVDVGTVSNVALSDDGQHVRVQLSLDRRMDKYLRSGTRFWIQGLDLSNLPSLMSALGGPSIDMEPGPGHPQHQFIGLEEAPAYTTPIAGSTFILLADRRGSVRQGAGVYYLGEQVGKVVDVQFVPPQQFRIAVLVRAPYDHLVHPGSRFWDAGALELSFSQGVKVQLRSPAALLEGAIAFDTPSQAAEQTPSVAGAQFQLYSDQQSAQRAPLGTRVLYGVRLPGAAGALQAGAAVKLRDFLIGEVRDVGLEYDARRGTLVTSATLELDPERLHIVDGGQGSDAQRLNAAVARLVREGLRARLTQDPPLIGPYEVSLDLVPGAHPRTLDLATSPPQIPAVTGGGLSALTARLSELPLQQIGANVRDITARVRTLVNSPQMQASLMHLDQTLTNIDQMVQQAAPQVQPLIASLRRAAGQLQGVAAAAHRSLGGTDEQGGLDQAVDEITRTARSVRSLADYLQRHPEALIRGKQP